MTIFFQPCEKKSLNKPAGKTHDTFHKNCPFFTKVSRILEYLIKPEIYIKNKLQKTLKFLKRSQILYCMLKNTHGGKCAYNSSRINQPAHNKPAARIWQLSRSYSGAVVFINKYKSFYMLKNLDTPFMSL